MGSRPVPSASIRAMTALTPLVPPGPARRRAGTLLLAYGIVGVLLLGGLFAATLAVAFMGRDGFERLDETIDEVVAVIDSTSAALVQADTTLAGVSVSLTATAAVIDEAAAVAGIAADGAVTLAEEVGGLSLLGQNPLAGIQQPLVDIGVSLEQLGIHLDAAGVSLEDNAQDVATLGERLGTVAETLTATRDRLANVDTQLFGAATLAIIVVLIILGWLAVPAVAAIWVGRRWRARNPKA